MKFESVGHMAGYLQRFGEQIGRMLDVPPEQAEQAMLRVLAAFKSAAIRNPAWLECEPPSVLRCAMWCAHLDLYPGGYLPDVYLIPRNQKVRGEHGDTWVKVLTAQPSWRGLKKLVERSGCKNVRVRAVYEGDLFEVWDGTEGAHLKHVPTFEHDDDFDKLHACYVLATLPSGVPMFHVISKRGIERHRASSDSYNPRGTRSPSGPWVDHPVPMAMKTAIADAVARGTLPILDDGKALGGEAEVAIVDIVADTDTDTDEDATEGTGLRQLGLRNADVDELDGVDPRENEREPALLDLEEDGSETLDRDNLWALVREWEESLPHEEDVQRARASVGIGAMTGEAISTRTRTKTLARYLEALKAQKKAGE